MSERFLGIDPGLNGYSAGLDTGGREGLMFWPAPTIPTGKGARLTYDLASMVRLAQEWAELGIELALIEKQQAFPGQGMTSTFSTGYGFGAWKVALTAAAIRFEEVRPDVWKRSMGIAGGDPEAKKARAVAKAQQLRPKVDFRALERKPGARVPCPDKAEAFLLALYACRTHRGRLVETTSRRGR